MLRFAAVAALLLSLAPAHAVSPLFAARQDIATGAKGLRGLAVADFNGDGKPDIAITDVYAKSVSVLLNDGKGSFSSPLLTTVNIGSTFGLGILLAGDVNEDGKQDLIVTSVGGQQPTYVLLGNGDGHFTQAALVPGSVTQGRLVDINGDGHLDLVGVNATLPTPIVALGDGRGNFTAVSLTQPIAAATGPYGQYTGVVTADFNRDGHTDLIAAQFGEDSSYTPALQYYAGVGNGTFLAPQTIRNGSTFYTHGTLAAADFNSDGKLDLLDGSAIEATIFPGYGDGTFDLSNNAHSPYFPVMSLLASFVTVAAPDLNVDGFADILVAVPVDNRLYAFLNEGKGDFYQNTADFSAALAGSPGTLLTADLNGDGRPDIIVTDVTNQNVSYFLSIRPQVAPVVTLTTSASQILTGGTVSINAVVSGSTSKASGTVTLMDGTQTLGSAALDGNGTATFALPSLSPGSHSLTLTYPGDSNYLPASGAGSVTVAVTDVTPTLPTPSQTIAAGGTATYSLSLTPIANFTGTASFTCSGLPTGYACASSAVSLAGQATTTTIRVVAGSASLMPPANPFVKPSRSAAIVSALLLMTFFLPWRHKGTATRLLFLFGAMFAGGLVGCSGGGSGSSSTTPTTPTAPTAPTAPAAPSYHGTTNFTITTTLVQGSQTAMHTTTATLVVQ